MVKVHYWLVFCDPFPNRILISSTGYAHVTDHAASMPSDFHDSVPSLSLRWKGSRPRVRLGVSRERRDVAEVDCGRRAEEDLLDERLGCGAAAYRMESTWTLPLISDEHRAGTHYADKPQWRSSGGERTCTPTFSPTPSQSKTTLEALYTTLTEPSGLVWAKKK